MLRKYIVAPALVIALVTGGYASTTQAAVIGTQQALSAEVRAAKETQIRASLARDDVRQAMQRMGGQVEVANAPEGGLVVHLRLRRARHVRAEQTTTTRPDG